MPALNLFHFQPQASTPRNVRANPNMFDPQYAAASRVGQAVAGLGDVAANAMVRVQRANSFKHVAEMDMGLQEEWDNFQNNLNPSTDETKWQADWQKKLDARVAKTMPKDAGPQLKQELQLRTQNFRVRTSGDVGQQAKAVGVQKAKMAGLARTDQLWRNGDAAGAEQSLNEMAGLGLILPEEVPQLVQRGSSRMEAQQVTNMIASGQPLAAQEALTEKTPTGRWKNFTKLDEDDRLTLLNHARTQTTAMQSANYQDLIDGLSNGEVRNGDELQQLVDRKLITPKQRKTYETAYRHGSFNTKPEDIGELLSDVANYDPQKDPDQTERAKLLGRIATTGFPQNVQSEANQLLGKKADPQNVLNNAVAKDAFEGIDQRFRLGIYGKYESRSMITTGPMAGQWTTTVDKGVYEKAIGTKRRVEDATRRYLEQTPNATAEQVNKFVSDVQLGETVKAGRAAIMDGLGLPTAPKPDDDAKARRARLDAILSRK